MDFIELCEKIVELLRERALLHMDFYSYLSGDVEQRAILKDIERNSNAKLVFRDSDAFMPVVIEGELLGAFVMKQAHKQSGYTIDRVQKMLEKVVAICMAGGSQALEQTIEEHVEIQPCMFLATGSLPDQHKAAMAAHETSKRFAFLSSTAIGKDNFSSVENIEKIGPITVWIENIATLTSTEQEAVAGYVNKYSEAHENMPFIVMSSERPLAELSNANILSENLRKVLLAQSVAVSSENSNSQSEMNNVIAFDKIRSMKTGRSSDQTLH